MKEIFKSATRIVLVVIVLTLCVTTAYIVIRNADKPEVVSQVIGVFSMMASSISAFYFKNSNSSATNEKTTAQDSKDTQSEA